MTLRGDMLTLGLLAALTAGAAARGRRGGRNLSPEIQRDLWRTMLGEKIYDLNEVQLQAFRDNRFVMPNGEPAKAWISLLRWTQDRQVTPASRWKATIRGPRFEGYGVEICEGLDEESTFLEEPVLVLAPEPFGSSRSAWRYFFLPEGTQEDWC